MYQAEELFPWTYRDKCGREAERYVPREGQGKDLAGTESSQVKPCDRSCRSPGLVGVTCKVKDGSYLTDTLLVSLLEELQATSAAAYSIAEINMQMLDFATSSWW